MQLRETKEILNKFGRYVVQQGRSILAKDKKKGNIYKQFDYVPFQADGFIGVKFVLPDYAKFVDQGVKGKDPSKVSPNAKITGQQAPNSPFRFGTGTMRGSFDKFAKRMSLFAKERNIRFRQGKTGKFAKGGYNSMGYVIAKNIYYRGLKPTMFFTKPFNKAYENLPPEIQKAFVTDFEKIIID